MRALASLEELKIELDLVIEVVEAVIILYLGQEERALSFPMRS